MDRRGFLSVAAAAAAGAIAKGGAKAADSTGPGLYDKIKGCIAGAFAGSAMGVPVEGWDRRKIAERYGLLSEFLPRRGNHILFPPGTTEDGMERQKYMFTAIIEKQDRITADDLVGAWLKVITPEKREGMKWMTEQFDRDLMDLAISGKLPARRLGEKGYAHLSAPIRCFHPICIINACDEDGAMKDTHDVLRVYQPADSDAFEWGAAYNAAVAHALRPDSTIDSVIETALKHSTPGMQKEIQAGLDIAAKYPDPITGRVKLYEDFAQIYNKQTCTGYYDMSRAHECATIAISFFKAAKGNAKDAIILATNNGRDTDCNSAAAGALAGAFSGVKTIPAEWLETIDSATKKNPYTNSQLTIDETAKGMFSALRAKAQKMSSLAQMIT